MSGITVLIPTLNEEPNIDQLVHNVLAVRDKCGLEFDLLFVDSDSSDGTCEKVEAWSSNGSVHLLKREVNLGLAGAVIAGAHHISSQYVLVMDADLSHPPDAIPKLLDPLITDSCDMVIGSRYIVGGSTPDWPFSRRLSSRLATFPALLFCSVKDPLAGFFAVRRERLIALEKDVPGFKIALAILAEQGSALRVREVPIAFRDRDCGESKMNSKVILDYCRQLLSLTFRRLRF